MAEITIDIKGVSKSGKTTVLHHVLRSLREQGFHVSVTGNDEKHQEITDAELAIRTRLLRESTMIKIEEQQTVKFTST